MDDLFEKFKERYDLKIDTTITSSVEELEAEYNRMIIENEQHKQYKLYKKVIKDLEWIAKTLDLQDWKTTCPSSS